MLLICVCLWTGLSWWFHCTGAVVVVTKCSQPDRPRTTTLLSPLSNGKPEAATAVDKLLMMGTRMPETYWVVFKRRAVNLRDWCIWLVDLFEYLNFKFSFVVLKMGRLQLKCDGTRWRMGGEVKGKLANGVRSQYTLHYLGTWCIQHYYCWCAHLGCQ